MADSLLQQLTSRVFDESQPLAGLLRICLMLGAETGSEALREWARYELNGYAPDQLDDLPEYRKIPTPVIVISAWEGAVDVPRKPYHRNELPPNAQELIDPTLPFPQAVRTLEGWTRQGVPWEMTNVPLQRAHGVMRQQAPEGTRIYEMAFLVDPSVIAGVVDSVRTRLVEIVVDLTAGTPLTESPPKGAVDAAVVAHIGVLYNTVVHTSGPTAIGDKAQAASGVSVTEVLRLLDQVRTASREIPRDEDRDALVVVAEELGAEVTGPAPDANNVASTADKLRAVAARIGVDSVSSAVGALVTVLITASLGGGFT